MTTEAPAPPMPPDADLRDHRYMPLDVVRLRDAAIVDEVSADEFRAAVLLWCAAWHQVPAGSLPDNDVQLAKFAGYGRVVGEWMKVRKGALYGFVRCGDGRLYHPVVAEKALQVWGSKLERLWRKQCDRLRKENKQREAANLGLLPLPEKPKVVERLPPEAWNFPAESGDFPAENGELPSETEPHSGGNARDGAGSSAGIPAEIALKGKERKEKGKEREERKNSAPQGGVPPDPDPAPPKPPDLQANQRTQLFARASEVLGSRPGGLVQRLIEHYDGSIPLARAALERAAESGDKARAYITAVLRKQRPTAMPDLLGPPAGYGSEWF